MLKVVFSSLVSAVVLMSPALAQSTPAAATTEAVAEQNAIPSAADECMKPAFELADAAEIKQLPDASLDKLDTMFLAMERYCLAQQVAEAKTVAGEIKSFIETAQ